MESKKKQRVKKLLRLTELLQKAMGKSDVPIHQAAIFLMVATSGSEGIEYKDLMKATGLVSSSMSRNIAALGEWHRLGRPGLGLVVSQEDYLDRRIKRVYLTKKGLKVIDEIIDEGLL